eukprot:21858_1
MQRIVHKYTDPSEKKKLKSCNQENVFAVNKCKHIKYILDALNLFDKEGFEVNIKKYNLCDLLEAYDHIVDVHQFCKINTSDKKESTKQQPNKEHIHPIKQYITDKIGYCAVQKDCLLLKKHATRRRENQQNDFTLQEHQLRRQNTKHSGYSDDKDDNSLEEIIAATLNALHCYILHKKEYLFRLLRSNDNLHFITKHDDETDKKEEEKIDIDQMLSIKFGLSVLEWMKYDENPQFSSFREEIVSNPNSTINQKLFLTFAQECFIKMIGRKREQYTLNEMMSLKMYTDTDSYQSALRKSFWKSSSKSVKKSFYQWATQLYKTSLFHGRPTPRWTIQSAKPLSIFHGLNMVLVLENALP